jgi:sortase A
MRRWIERLLLLSAMSALGIFLGSIARTAISQDWESRAFEREKRGEPASVGEYVAEMPDRLMGWVRSWRASGAPSREPAARVAPAVTGPGRARVIEKNSLIGRLTIPRLHVAAMVREGDEDRTLDLALGHIPHTALPGESGNVGVAGHRDTFFRSLEQIRSDDVIHFETLEGTFTYQVASLKIVRPESVEVLEPGKQPELTLVTCYPFNYVGSAPKRFIVKASQISKYARPGSDSKPNTVLASSAETVLDIPRRRPAERKISFGVVQNHSRSLTPGISVGVTDVDPATRRMNGWMWLMPDRRTIWLKRQTIGEPVVFYGQYDGKKRQLFITGITRDRVTGYLLLPE